MTTKAQRLAKKRRKRWQNDLRKEFRRAGFNVRTIGWRIEPVPTYDTYGLGSFATPAIETPDIVYTMTVEDTTKAQAILNRKDTNDTLSKKGNNDDQKHS